jgi:hypothetical protein
MSFVQGKDQDQMLGGTLNNTTPPSGLDLNQIIVAIETLEKGLYQRLYELEVRIGQMEQARNREFEAELARRLNVGQSKGYIGAITESPSSRLRRADRGGGPLSL